MMNDLTQPLTHRIFGNLDHFVNEALRSFGPAPAARAPGAYRYEDDDSYTLRLEIPGYSKGQVSLSITERELTISAENPETDSSYQRTITLSETVDESGISAKLEHGILELGLPKVKVEEPVSRTIKLS
ncbi:MAG: Hsp20/alpha crystallin family protein [Akkermansiaceae bacterium]